MADKSYSIPGHIRRYIEDRGYSIPNDAMSGYIDDWLRLYKADSEFWDYEETDGKGHLFKVHRRSLRPFKRVCVEWSSLILGDKTYIGTDNEACNEWLDANLPKIGFMRTAQGLVQRTFAIGTGCFAVWFDQQTGEVKVRRYDARQIIPLSWDDDGVSEVALCTRVTVAGEEYDQLQMHLLGEDGYHILNLFFDKHGDQVELEGSIAEYPTGSRDPWFAVIKPALDNDLVDLSPFGVSVYSDAVDALQSVDLTYDAMVSEVDLGKLRIFLNDMLFQVVDGEGDEGAKVIPFGMSDAMIYRQAASDDSDMIESYAPQLRTEAQAKVYRLSLQTMGDLCGFGLGYFDIDETGGLKTATEVSADNSQLMRNLRNHENIIQGAIETIVRALLIAANQVGALLPYPKKVTMRFDDSIIVDTAAEKAQDMTEVSAGLMNVWEYRVKWYGESEEEAKKNAPGFVEDPMVLG